MGRPAKYDSATILRAASQIIANGGPAAATIAAISDAVGAPNGSIYHRFPTREHLLGQLWLETATSYQDAWADAAHGKADPVEAGLAAALSMPAKVRKDPLAAKVMLLHRREDFIAGGWPSELAEEAKRLIDQVKTETADLARRLFGKADRSAIHRTAFATIDLPFAAVRRSVEQGSPLPSQTEDLIERAYRGLIES